ncbi:MAG: CDC27 family protein [Bacteroidia bacterium]|nr:CDC27 family protein [Bacteroidia bacterium]
MDLIRIVFTLLAMSLLGHLSAQNKHLEKGNKLYQVRKYSAAIPFYEAGIAANRNLSALSKLANCYRMNNKFKKASELYEEIVQEERANPRNFYYYGECLLTLGKYEEAQTWFEIYYDYTKDEKGLMMLASLKNINNIAPFFDESIEVLPFAHNSEFDEFAPVLYDGGIVFSTDRHIGKLPLKIKNKWTNREYLKIAYSEQLGLIEFREPKSYSTKINAIDRNTSNTTFTVDGTTVFYCQNDFQANSKYTYPLQLYYRKRKRENGSWSSPIKVPFVSAEHNYMHPLIDANGETLYFVSDKGNGHGGTDIYVSQRIGEDEWTRPKNLGPNINTAANEGFPFLFEGRLFFSSKGHTTLGGFDIFYSELDEKGEWVAPVNLGEPVNSPLDDISIFISKVQKMVLFTSSRKNESDDIFLFRYTKELFPEDRLEAQSNQGNRTKEDEK